MKVFQLNTLQISCWCLAGLFLLSAVAHAEPSKQVRPEIIEGTLDLTDWDLQTDGPAALGGQWLFGWKLQECLRICTISFLAHLLR